MLYRPVSLTSTIVRVNILNTHHLISNNLISSNQFGFLDHAGHSCTTQLLATCNGKHHKFSSLECGRFNRVCISAHKIPKGGFSVPYVILLIAFPKIALGPCFHGQTIMSQSIIYATCYLV